MSRRKALSVDPLFVVNRFVDAANRHDAEAVAACVHRDFESLQPIHPVRNFRGSAQLLANWRAIFRNEPGFRLTMLRSVVDGDTVWVELHGAGDQAEVAGIFIVGVENGLIRWVRVYSELVEPPPEPVVEVVPLIAGGDAPQVEDGSDDDAGAGGEVRRLRLVEEGEEAAAGPAEGVVAAEAALTAEEAAAKDEAAKEVAKEPTAAKTAAEETAAEETAEQQTAEQQPAPDEATATPEPGHGRRRFGKRQRRK